MVLFVVIILLFGLLAGLYVVNQQVTVQNRAAEPTSGLLPTSGTAEEPYIECRWQGEADVQYSYKLFEVDIKSGAEKELPGGMISLNDNLSSVIYRKIAEGKVYRCEVYVGAPKCGEATYAFSKVQITLTPTPTGSPRPTGSGSTMPTSAFSTSFSTNAPTSAPTSGSIQIVTGTSSSSAGSSSSASLTGVASSDSEASDSVDASSTNKGGLTSTKTPTPPVTGVTGLSMLLLAAGLLIVVFGFLL